MPEAIALDALLAELAHSGPLAVVLGAAWWLERRERIANARAAREDAAATTAAMNDLARAIEGLRERVASR